jgi:dihydropteroate synthase
MLLPIRKKDDGMRYIVLRNGTKFIFDSLKIMGIINATPDSFYKGSRTPVHDDALLKAEKMIEEGADILDIGGESTRPGSDPVSAEDEVERVIPLIRSIRNMNSEILISVDTYRARTAEEAVKAGADIVNDISAMSMDPGMADVVHGLNVPIILMHMKGTPKVMQKEPLYNDVVKEVLDYLGERIAFAEGSGISREKVIIDPGIGFGKLYEHNVALIKRINEFSSLGCPVLLAASRKSSIGTALGGLPAEERLEGTMAVSCYAALKGVDIIRVHDVKENKRAVMMIEVLK